MLIMQNDMETKKQYKMISVTYTNTCLKSPKCSFCYLDSAKQDIFNFHKHFNLFKHATEQIAIAYNGTRLDKTIYMLDYLSFSTKDVVKNITTSPEFLDENLVAIFKRYGVSMVSLSLDPEKCTIETWLEKAKLVIDGGLHLGANILMLDGMWVHLNTICERISMTCHTIHLLRPKFYKTIIPLKLRKNLAYLIRDSYKNVFIDECFKNEFQNIPCTRGKDFISINCDNSVSLCSFDIDGIENVKKCPYI